jgi:hypothetical protein
MIAQSDAAPIFRGTRGSRSIEISVPGAFTAVGFSGQQKNTRASAAERGRPSLFKTIDEDRRERHDHTNRSDRSTYPGRISVLRSGATPDTRTSFFLKAGAIERPFGAWYRAGLPFLRCSAQTKWCWTTPRPRIWRPSLPAYPWYSSETGSKYHPWSIPCLLSRGFRGQRLKVRLGVRRCV